MDSGGFLWAIINIVGPLILVVVLAWAVIRNRKSRGNIGRTEQATRELYREEEAARVRREDNAP
ncbi:MAG: hypothetical protein JWN69_947 [Alphaproteobacteria bacterium]|nr:hypothetical protein [Alphaproteobacteria bacterium]